MIRKKYCLVYYMNYTDIDIEVLRLINEILIYEDIIDIHSKCLNYYINFCLSISVMAKKKYLSKLRFQCGYL